VTIYDVEIVQLVATRDPIPESGHERLWQNVMREKDKYIYICTISVYSF